MSIITLIYLILVGWHIYNFVKYFYYLSESFEDNAVNILWNMITLFIVQAIYSVCLYLN